MNAQKHAAVAVSPDAVQYLCLEYVSLNIPYY